MCVCVCVCVWLPVVCAFVFICMCVCVFVFLLYRGRNFCKSDVSARILCVCMYSQCVINGMDLDGVSNYCVLPGYVYGVCVCLGLCAGCV